jgi:hypothetical protein
MEQLLTRLDESNDRSIGDVVCFQACKYRCAIELISIISECKIIWIINQRLFLKSMTK